MLFIFWLMLLREWKQSHVAILLMPQAWHYYVNFDKNPSKRNVRDFIFSKQIRKKNFLYWVLYLFNTWCINAIYSCNGIFARNVWKNGKTLCKSSHWEKLPGRYSWNEYQIVVLTAKNKGILGTYMPPRSCQVSCVMQRKHKSLRGD